MMLMRSASRGRTAGPAQAPAANLLTLNAGLDGTAGYVYLNFDAAFAGATRFPTGDYGRADIDNLRYCSDPIIAIGSQADRIVIAGRNQGERVSTIAEFAYTLSTASTLASLPIATNTQEFVEVLTTAPVDGETWSGRMIAGMANIDGMLVVTAYGYYDFTNRPVMVLDDVADLAGSGIRGYFDITNRQRAGGWITSIPDEHQADFDGTHFFGFSMSQTRAIVTKYSIGPSAYAYDFSAADSITSATPVSNGSTLSTTIALDYDPPNGITHQDDLGASGSDWTFCSGGQIGFIVPNTRTYMVIGSTGGEASGSEYWDPPANTAPYDASFKGYGPGSEGDIGNAFWLVDVEDMKAVVRGEISPHAVVPYEHGMLSVRFDGGTGWNDYHRVGGGTFDPITKTLLLTLMYADDSQAAETAMPVLVAYDLSGVAA